MQQWPGVGDNGIEADNHSDPGRDNLPRSHPVLSNISLVGVPTSTRSDYGMLLREGTGAEIHNAVILGFEDACIDIDHMETWTNAMTSNGTSTVATGGLLIANSIVSCVTPFEEEAEDPVTVDAFVTSMNPGNQVVAAGADILSDPLNRVSWDMQPSAGGPAESGAVVPADSFFESVTFKGGMAPGSDWTLGWTTKVVN